MNRNALSVQRFIQFINTFKYPSCQVKTGQVLNAETYLLNVAKLVLIKLSTLSKATKKERDSFGNQDNNHHYQ